MSGLLSTLDHLVIGVRDLDAATRTYASLLGRLPSWRGDHPGAGTANTLFRLDRTYVELLAPVSSGPLADPLRAHLDAAGEGPYAIAFGTHDAAGCAAALRERGLEPGEAVEGHGRDRTSHAERHWCTVMLPPQHTRGVRMLAIEHRTPADGLPLVAPTHPDGAVHGVDHAVIMTNDAEQACALYRDKLGLRLAFDRTFEARGVRLMFFRIGGVTVEVAASLAGANGGDDRFWGISWRVDDLDAAHARLTGAGFEVSEVRPGHKAGTRVCTVHRETHGVATLVLEPAAAKP